MDRQLNSRGFGGSLGLLQISKHSIDASLYHLWVTHCLKDIFHHCLSYHCFWRICLTTEVTEMQRPTILIRLKVEQRQSQMIFTSLLMKIHSLHKYWTLRGMYVITKHCHSLTHFIAIPKEKIAQLSPVYLNPVTEWLLKRAGVMQKTY